jgi:hypothetical protein
MKTQDDLDRVWQILKRLEELGLPYETWRALRIWYDREAEKILAKEAQDEQGKR